MKRFYRPEKVYIEKGAEEYPFTQSLLGRLGHGNPNPAYEVVVDKKILLERIRCESDPIGAGKRFLYLTVDRGQALKPFPNPEGTRSCRFYTLNLMEGCDLECSYCILQAYLTNPFLTLYVNVEEILERLDSFLRAHPAERFRVGTGQLADSLSLDPLTRHSEVLVPFFARRENALLELKTKSVYIANLKGLEPQGKTVVSWSLNAKRIQWEEEHRCASIEERIRAAKQCSDWGYRIGFHFDPLIHYEGALEEYGEVIEEALSEIPQEKIAWVSFGSFRFMPPLKPIMERRFPKSPLPYAEWVRGIDGKVRHAKPKRIELYRGLVRKLRGRAPRVPIYLCMETEDVWQKVFEGIPHDPASKLDLAGFAC